MPADACDRDADGLEYGPSIDALVEILEREERLVTEGDAATRNSK